MLCNCNLALNLLLNLFSIHKEQRIFLFVSWKSIIIIIQY